MNFFTDYANTTSSVNMAFLVLIFVTGFFFVITVGPMLYFVIRYNKKRHPKPQKVKEPLWVELTWTIIPIIIVCGLFAVGWLGYAPLKKSYEGAFEIEVIGRMWNWTFKYPNGKETQTDLYLPVRKPIQLKIVSMDVNHNFFVPAFRIKQDAIPGNINYLSFIPQQTGEYQAFCAEYCGLQHAAMLAKVHVLRETDFADWYAKEDVKDKENQPSTERVTPGEEETVAPDTKH